MLVDVNGLKGPNREGVDRFSIIYDGFCKGCSREALISNCSANRNAEYIAKSAYCYELIMRDSWQIKEDYPIRI